MEPTEVAAEMFGGDARAGAQEILLARETVIDGLDVSSPRTCLLAVWLMISWLTTSAAAQNG
jgi:hypothetical protein